MSVVFTTVYSGVTLNTDVTKGVVDRFRTLPLWRPAPLVGALLGDTVRYLIAGTATVGSIGIVLATTIALTCVFASLTVYLYRNKN